MVETPCPGCRRPVKARDDQVGRRVKCSKCGTRFHVPADARDVLDFDDAPAPRRRGNLLRRLLAVVLLGLAAAGAVGGAVLFVQSRRPVDPDPVPTPGPETAAAPSPAGPAAAGTPAAPAAKTEAKAKEAAPAAFPNARPVTFMPLGEPPEPLQKPATAVGLEVPFAAARRVFPPQVRDHDPAVLWESRAAFQGVGGQLTLSVFSRQTGGRVGGLTFDADTTQNPICDLSGDHEAFAHAAGGKVTVWRLKDGAKLLDGFDPYADRPADKAAGLAAAYLAAPADRVVTVSRAGAVHVWEVASRRPVGSFAPPAGRPAVAAIDSVRGAVLVAAGGSVYRVELWPEVKGEKVAELGAGVGRPVAVAPLLGSRLGVVFEAAGPTPARVVAELRDDGKHHLYRWPAGAGDPVSGSWSGDDVLSVGTTTGAAVWFLAEGDGFRPLALVRVPGEKGIHAGAENHWSLLPGRDGRSVLVEHATPPEGTVDPLNANPSRPAVTLRLDAGGLYR